MSDIKFSDGGDWRDRAACRAEDPELFFPEPGGRASLAKKVCGGCPVSVQCLAFALENDIFEGIFGGLGEKQRRVLKRRAA